MNVEHFRTMDGYTFDEGVAFLVLVKAPLGVINHLKSTHNRNHLHSEIHKQLRFPRVREIVRKNGMVEPTPQGSNDSNRGQQPTADQTQNRDKIEPKSDNNEPKSNENKPKSDENEPESEDPCEIILTKQDVRKHENTRYEDMPNDITRELWLKRQDLYREMQQNHLKMRQVPKGEEHNEERAKYRAEVLRLDEEIDGIWKLIDAEIERFRDEQERADKKANEKPDFDVSTYRSYISKALRKKSLNDFQRVELQHRVDALLKAKVEMKQETIEKLKDIGIIVKKN